VHLYPKPKQRLIIEPFAGSARYALKYFDRDVILIDANPVVIGIWNYLQTASEKDILSLPDTKGGCDLRKFDLTEPQRHLVYFCSTSGGAASTGYKVRGGSYNRWDTTKPQIAKQLFKIRHWQIIAGDYSKAPDVEATWFVDPPYFKGGHKYKFGNKRLNFSDLKNWCESRKGQTIVCENTSANWLPFIEIAKTQGVKNTNTTEVFWTNEKVQTQANLF
jgi:hypothetical protein